MSALSDLRNALFVPVGDDESHIEVAAVTHVGYDDVMTAGTWTAADEKAHPRDSEGKFTEKGLGTAGKIADLLKHVAGAKNGSVALSGKTKSGMQVRIVKLYGGQYHIQVREPSESKWETTATLSGESELKNYLSKASANWETPAKKLVKDKFIGAPAPKYVMDQLAEQSKPVAPDENWKPDTTSTVKKASKPYVNTNVIYKQKHSDGAVVAERTNPDGTPSRLLWDAKQKKFIVQNKLKDGGGWLTAAKYGKGDAYQKLSKQEGWHAPGAAAEETAVAAGPKPLHINTNVIYKQKYADQQVVAVKPGGAIHPAATDRRLIWDASSKKFVLQDYYPDTGKWSNTGIFGVFGKGEAYQKFSKETGWHTPSEPGLKSLAAAELKKLEGKTATPAAVTDLPTSPVIISLVVKPHGYVQHEQATQTVKFVGDIGQPKTGVTAFKSVSIDEMKQIQAKSKTSWTPAQVAAVGRYTTSGGYQSMNGVLRNDEGRLKLFSESQLEQAVADAQNVQDAMAPLAESLELHRGTGAQAFGFDKKSVSTAELKKLEGTVIQDHGFVSTSVVAPTHVSYDYAKKPIKVIIHAPEGTPAVYVSSVTPGWSSENEVILGAGSSYHVKHVRAATEADKALYGDHTQQVVILEVVPTVDKPQPKPLPGVALAPNAAPAAHLSKLQTKAATSSSVSTPLKSQGSPAGTPIKLNTKVIHTTKYADGVVVAVKPNLTGGLNQRLVWSESTKKFVLQEEKTPGAGDWTSLAPGFGKTYFTKKDAYNKFSKETGWVTPEPGAKAHGTGYPFGSAVTPSVSNTVATTLEDSTGLQLKKPIDEMSKSEFLDFVKVNKDIIKADEYHETSIFKKAAAKLGITDTVANILLTSSPLEKTSSMDAATLQKMHGVIPDSLKSNATARKAIVQSFKFASGEGTITLTSPPIKAFKALKHAVDEYNKTSSEKLNALQVLRIIDEIYTPVGQANQHLYEKKIVDWLQTPSGKSTATKIWSGTLSDAAALLNGIPAPITIGTPSTKSTVFPSLSESQARAMQANMNMLKPWTPQERSALHRYTGSKHKEINAVLRQAGPGWKNIKDSETQKTKWRAVAKDAQAAMRPALQSFTTYRRTEKDALAGMGITNLSGFEDIKKLEGKVFTDRGFGSSSIDPNKWSGYLKFVIEVPEGTPVAWVDDISQHSGEQEILFAAGTRYRIDRVEDEGWQAVLYVRVVP